MTPDADRGGRDQARLFAALRDPACFPERPERVSALETHISHVLLTGRFAYKIKKAVAFGFLDFTTLAARRFFCEEELRLNRRLAPALYLDVVSITGSLDAPRVGGEGRALEYAVRMREFAQDQLASRLLERGELGAADVDALAATVASFHGAIQAAAPGAGFGSPEGVRRAATDNFAALRPLVGDAEERARLDRLSAWTEREFAGRRGVFLARVENGFVRECHGDLHLGNVARIDGELTVFDCIEFNPALRWIDVMSEIAFTVMDLEHRGRADLARRFLNAYLEITGDYAGLACLRFYLVYRAMVRAKVARLRAEQLAADDAGQAAIADYRDHLRLAERYAATARPAIVITHGLSGSGKTTLSQALLEALGAVRVRSDVERKRLHGAGVRERDRTGIDRGIYASDATQATYERLATLAGAVVDAGLVAVVDAAFLQRWQRDRFADLASRLGVPFAIVDFVASESSLRERVARRSRADADASDADLAVLEHQLRAQEPLGPDEQDAVVRCDADAPLEAARARGAWDAVAERIAPRDREPRLDPGLGPKLAFLCRRESYPHTTSRVDVVETHMSWVFLTDSEAWKLKKPVRTRYLDFSSEPLRRADCEAELRLNRRLSDDVYRAVVPLSLDADGRLTLGADGRAIDWLVRMRRLAAERMLDRLLGKRAVRPEALEPAIERLAAFYRDAPGIDMAHTRYRERFAEEIAENRRTLIRPAYGLSRSVVDGVCDAQLELLEALAELLGARAARVVEAHGDLRPEHICLETPPQIIDCLEFSRELRLLDPADELAFLALECERLGAPELGGAILAVYTRVTGDAPPPLLLDFYRSMRAGLRARIAIAHLADAAPREPARWTAQAEAYLALAGAYARRCAG
ncbi:MAG TPA: AAA family ATPase [Casimicrobiaceae bacterium]|nr:AAA family ATPase [Casimicrobiaceae bacterium]